MTASSCMSDVVVASRASEVPLSRDVFLAALQAVGERGYHDKHPFHQRMHRGELTREQLRAWIANRFYYQAMIPRKDAALMAKTFDAGLRQAWIRRMWDQDGDGAIDSGRSRWLALAQAAGLRPDDVESFRFVLPGVRFAVDAYLRYVTERSLLEAVASSLTELFASPLHSHRLSVFGTHYPWIEPAGLAYFESRIKQVPADLQFGLGYVVDRCETRGQQEAALDAVRFKCQVLWALLDALYYAHVSPGWLPPDFSAPAAVAS
jgi:pyrroloquinoline-quinone synthase